MRLNDKKSTPEQVEEMRKLYKAGLSLIEISRRLHRDHSTLSYWLKKKGDYIPKRISERRRISKNGKIYYSKVSNQPKIIEIKPKVIEKKTPEEKSKFCLVCGKEKKDLKWQKTNYDSLHCWDQATCKEVKQNWWWWW